MRDGMGLSTTGWPLEGLSLKAGYIFLLPMYLPCTLKDL